MHQVSAGVRMKWFVQKATAVRLSRVDQIDQLLKGQAGLFFGPVSIYWRRDCEYAAMTFCAWHGIFDRIDKDRLDAGAEELKINLYQRICTSVWITRGDPFSD
jgi:hypothetical protein